MLTAVTMVRDEADVIETVLRHLFAHGVDEILIADNLSTDETPQILKGLEDEGLPLVVLRDDEVGYYQDVKMSRLAKQAHDRGADWVLPFDADEIWYPANGGTLRGFFSEETADIIEGHGWDHLVTVREGAVMDFGGPQWFDLDRGAFSRMRRAHQQTLPKVAFRACENPYVHMGNHDVNRNQGQQVRTDGLLYRHFQYRSLEQYIRKVRNGREAYEASDLHYLYGTHWREAGALSDDELAERWHVMCREDGLVFDPAPIR